MKKLIYAINIILLLSISVGCIQNPIVKNRGNMSIEDYYPFKGNIKMEYEGIGNEFAERTTFIEYIGENRAQLKIFNPGSVIVKVLEYGDGELREIYSEGEFYHIENMLDVNNEYSDVLLKEPLKVGTTWTTLEGYKRSITGTDVEIKTPYKTFRALEVTTEYGEDRKQLDYYAKDIGHIATIYTENGGEIKTLLEDIEEEPYEIDIRFYYPSNNNDKIYYVEKEVEFETNKKIEEIFEYNLKNPDNDVLFPPISRNTTINSIKLDRGNEIIRVDFSEELISEMNAGSSMEIEMLKSLVNTFGNYYRVDKVYISIEGEPYSSGHFILGEDEFFSVDYTNTEEFDIE